MTFNITIKNPSPGIIQFFDGLREKKRKQIKKMKTSGTQCTFSIKC
ncbi:MAG: hypothetical protein NC187_06035 [Candidatus Amulumruptor caecigallinarius]|nr:hypothetical protein [Candidatus Amulumruptor caecigallinarius]MCM1397029.1 hypothetical protein [Candidatus Amulumruptor caecigallinarius]